MLEKQWLFSLSMLSYSQHPLHENMFIFHLVQLPAHEMSQFKIKRRGYSTTYNMI